MRIYVSRLKFIVLYIMLIASYIAWQILLLMLIVKIDYLDKYILKHLFKERMY